MSQSHREGRSPGPLDATGCRLLLALRELVDCDAIHGDVPQPRLARLVAHDLDAGDGHAEGPRIRLTALELDMRPAVAKILVRAVRAAEEQRRAVGVNVEARRNPGAVPLDIERELRELLALNALELGTSRDRDLQRSGLGQPKAILRPRGGRGLAVGRVRVVDPGLGEADLAGRGDTREHKHARCEQSGDKRNALHAYSFPRCV